MISSLTRYSMILSSNQIKHYEGSEKSTLIPSPSRTLRAQTHLSTGGCVYAHGRECDLRPCLVSKPILTMGADISRMVPLAPVSP